VWLVIALLVGGTSWLVNRLTESAQLAGYTDLDPARIAFELPAGTEGLPQNWSAIVATRIVRLGQLSTLDEDGIEAIVAEVEALPFVIEVGEARVDWPDGLRLSIRLREPVACICIGEDYLPVASDGVVLPGHRATPPDYGRGILPVIGPLDEDFRDARPGDVLSQKRHLDALSVAVSMRKHLSRGDLDLLGPLVIDASLAQAVAIDQPGTRLFLEGGRTVFFGRPPSYGAPGELPVQKKWTHLMEAVDGLQCDVAAADEAGEWWDWDLVDIRWDIPTVRPRIGYR
jgi:hypothetical protein